MDFHRPEGFKLPIETFRLALKAAGHEIIPENKDPLKHSKLDTNNWLAFRKMRSVLQVKRCPEVTHGVYRMGGKKYAQATYEKVRNEVMEIRYLSTFCNGNPLNWNDYKPIQKYSTVDDDNQRSITFSITTAGGKEFSVKISTHYFDSRYPEKRRQIKLDILTPLETGTVNSDKLKAEFSAALTSGKHIFEFINNVLFPIFEGQPKSKYRRIERMRWTEPSPTNTPIADNRSRFEPRRPPNNMRENRENRGNRDTWDNRDRDRDRRENRIGRVNRDHREQRDRDSRDNRNNRGNRDNHRDHHPNDRKDKYHDDQNKGNFNQNRSNGPINKLSENRNQQGNHENHHTFHDGQWVKNHQQNSGSFPRNNKSENDDNWRSKKGSERCENNNTTAASNT